MLMEDYQLDGIDYNWEYPGYRFENDMPQIKNYPLARILSNNCCSGWDWDIWKRRKC